MKRSVSPHEFFPVWIIYLPIIWDYFVYAWRLKTLRFPVLVNPAIELSGLVDESKKEIYNLLPKNLYPETHIIYPSQSLESQFFYDAKKKWIAKPDRGERGFGVKMILSREDLIDYHARAPREYLVQEFISGEFEAGVFFVRMPHLKDVLISSVVIKEKAVVIGNGEDSIYELCKKSERYKRQILRLIKTNKAINWNYVPLASEVYVLDEVRNHRRGALFRDGRALITKELSDAIHKIVQPIDGLNFGRIDLRCNSKQDFMQGKNISIVEVNGVTSEPGEIYDPSMSLSESWKILRLHWFYLFQVAKSELEKRREVPSWKSILALLSRARLRSDFFYR